MASRRRPQGDGMVRKRDDGRWEGRIVIGHRKNGAPMYKSVFGATQKSTLKQLHQLIDLYRDVDLTEECRMTLGEWMDKWLDEYMLFKIKENTLDGYRAIVEHQIKRFLGDKQLAYLTTADIQKFYNKIRKEGRVNPHPLLGYALSDSVVRKIHMTLHEALEAAVKERFIVRNPTNGTTIPRKSYGEKQVLGDSQLDRFMEAIRKEPYWYDFFYVEIMTGLRRGEICGLKWSDIDFTAGTMSVRRSVGRIRYGGIAIGETKTNAGTRKIIMPPSVAELLKTKKDNAINEWIFSHYMKPSDPLHPDTAYNKLKTILKSVELPLIRFHDLRHTFATHATQGGVDAKTLAGILGHTNASFTVNTKYGHTKRKNTKNKIREIKVALIQSDAKHKRRESHISLSVF
mgnify:CR=1 FL=1